MRRFRFGMERILDLRRGRLREVEGRYGAAQLALARHDREIARMQASREEHKRLLAAQAVGLLIRNEAIATRQYLDRTWLAILRTQAERRRAEERAEIVRTELVEARREVRTLELLRERRLAEWHRQADREETADLDDIRTRGMWAQMEG